MKSIIRTIHVRILDLDKYYRAMQEMASVTLKPWEVPVKGSAERIKRFRWWAATNAKTIKDTIEACQKVQESLIDTAKIEAYSKQRDLIHRSYASRDSKGQPKTYQDENGRSHYVIPENKLAKCKAALKDHDDRHQEIFDMRSNVDKYLAGSVPIELVCCDFRDVAFTVNGSYAYTFRELILDQPKLTPWYLRWIPGKYRVSPSEAVGVMMQYLDADPVARKALVDQIATMVSDECFVAASAVGHDVVALDHPWCEKDGQAAHDFAERIVSAVIG